MPADQAGLSRAGFFARRAYINEQIIELLLADGQDAEALRYAELAKARALHDLLATRGTRDNGDAARDVPAMLRAWPKQVAAVEYFLGTERAWVFVVDVGGKVKAHPLLAAPGKPLATRDLVARVRRFIADTGLQAQKMVRRINNGQGFDHSWQDILHRFYRELVPADALRDLRQAKTVVVVPHHILHYFPFAALVTERDARQRKASEMVEPKFLLDEAFTISYAPSLTSWDLLRQEAVRPIARVQAVGIAEFEDLEPLPGVARELQAMRDVFGARLTTVLAGETATKSKIKALFDRPGMLGIGTHGMNFADQPLDSHLVCRREPNTQPILTAAEIYATRVDADLVLLTACYSGLADRSPLPGDDLFGLQRASCSPGRGRWCLACGTSTTAPATCSCSGFSRGCRPVRRPPKRSPGRSEPF